MAVQLTGYQGPRGFKAEQVYDPSQQMQRAAEQDANIRERSTQRYREDIERIGRQIELNQKADLEALSSFSSTLSKSLEDFQKKQNETQYNLGLAEVLNGNAQLSDEVFDAHQKETEILRQSAEADAQTANQAETSGDIKLASELRSKSQAITGWRAYGRAVGLAKLGASNSQAFFTEFMDRTDPIIPLPDGRLIAPSQAENASELQAVMAIAQQEFVRTNKLSTINPVVLVEHLSPALQAVKGQVVANHLSEQTRKRKETAIDKIDSVIGLAFSNPNATADELSVDFQYNTEQYQIEGGLSRGAASERAVKQAIETIKTLPKELAEKQLLEFANVAKIKDEPNSIKLGSAYPDLFNDAADAIEDRAVAQQQRQEQLLNKQAEKAVALLEKARQDANMPPDQLRALRQETIQTLGILADKGSTSALTSRATLLAEPANVDYTLYRQYREGINQGKRPSADQIQKDFLAGKLTANMVEELKAYSTSSDRGDFIKQFQSSIKDAVQGHLREAGAISLNPFGQPLKHVAHVNQVINDLTDIAYKIYDAERRKGNALDDNAINQLIVNQIPRVVGRYFSQDPKTKEWTTRPISKNPAVTPDRIKSTLRGYVQDAGGFDPRTIRLRNLNSGSTVLLKKAEVEDNIKRLQNGQPPTQRAETLANSNGDLIRLLTHQAQHYDLDASTISNSPQAQRLAEYQRLAPRAAQRLVTSTDYMGQLLQLRRLAEAQQRRVRQQETGKNGQPSGDLKPGSQLGITDYLKLGLQQGLAPEKAILMAAVGMAESTGNSGAHNDNPATGDNSYGLWQINMIGDLGPARLRQYGLRSAEDLKDPETNARVMAQLLNGSGISAWGAYNDRRYLQYMTEARRAYAELKKGGL